MVRKITLIVCFFAVICAGCSNDRNQAGVSEIKEIQDLNQSKAMEAEKKTEELKEVTHAVSFVVEDELLVAFKVKQFDRFHLKKIEKKVKGLLEKEFPSQKLVVSSDLKIYLETIKLKKKFKDTQISNERVKKDFIKTIKLSEEQT